MEQDNAVIIKSTTRPLVRKGVLGLLAPTESRLNCSYPVGNFLNENIITAGKTLLYRYYI